MSIQFSLPHKIAQCVWPLDVVEYPPQGTAFQVAILSAAHGRFVLKVAHTPAMIRALSREAHILTALQQYAPFVAQPLADAQIDGGHAFLFSYLEGEPLHLILQQASAQER